MDYINIHNNNLDLLVNTAYIEFYKNKTLNQQKKIFNLIFQNINDIDLHFEKDLVDKIKYHIKNYCNFPNTILKKHSINPKYLEKLNYEVYSIVPKDFEVHVLFKCRKKKCGYSICGSKRYLSLSKVKYYLEKHSDKHKIKKGK
jgi:hypothetical protein